MKPGRTRLFLPAACTKKTSSCLPLTRMLAEGRCLWHATVRRKSGPFDDDGFPEAY
jgi:hypothetical protein